MKIIKYSLGQLQANCYFLVEGDKCLIIDPGDEGSFILEELQRKRLKLVGMLATHGHFDHIGAVGEIQLSLNTPLFINKKDQFLIDGLEKTAEHFLRIKRNIIKPTIIKYLTNKEFQISNFKFQILTVFGGHTPGSNCLCFPKENIVFTGDTLHKDAIGRFDHSYCSKNDFKKLLIKLSRLPEKTKVYPGHGEETTIKEEMKNLLYYINIL